MKFKPDQKTGLNCSVAVDQSVNRSQFISSPYLIFQSTQAHLLSFHRQQKSHILPPWHHARPHLYFKNTQKNGTSWYIFNRHMESHSGQTFKRGTADPGYPVFDLNYLFDQIEFVTCKHNSSLRLNSLAGPVVPLTMFENERTKI